MGRAGAVTGRPVGRVRKIVEITLGLVLVAVGVVFGFLPILQGWVLVLPGLALLARHSRRARAVYERVKSWGRRVRHRMKERRD